MTSYRNSGASAALVAAFSLSALSCDGASDDDGPTGNSGSFNIVVNPTSLTVAQGGSGFITVTLDRVSGFSGVVSLTISGTPNSVSATMDPAQLSGTTTQSRVDFAVSGTATPGTTTVTVKATSGGRETTASFVLTIFPAPNYTLTLTPTALAISAGTSGTATVSIQRSNFSGNLSIEILDPPAGVTWGITPTTDPNSWLLSIAVAASMLPGNYPLTVRGGGFGAPERFELFQLTVTPAPSGGVGLEYSFCDPVNAPAYFAYQDGTGAWQRVTSVTSGGVVRFPFNITSNQGGVMAVYRISLGTDLRIPLRHGSAEPSYPQRVWAAAVARRPSGVLSDVAALSEVFIIDVMYMTKAELAQEAGQSCARSFPTKTVRGTVVGVPPGQYGVVALGESGTIFDGATSRNPVVFSDVQSGLVDFFGTRTTPGQLPDRAVMFRKLNPADNGTLPQVIDFNGPASFQPASATVTITGGLGHRLEVYTGVHTATSNVGFWNDIAPTTNATRPWAGLNAANMAAGDFHGITVFAGAPNEPNNFRATVKYVGAVSNQSIAFGPIADAAATSLVSGGAFPRYRFQGVLPAEYNKGVGFTIATDGEGNTFSAYVTSAYLAVAGNAAAYDLIMPDVAGLAGFPAAARLTAGANSVVTDAFGFTGVGVFNVVPALGGEFRASVRTQSIMVP